MGLRSGKTMTTPDPTKGQHLTSEDGAGILESALPYPSALTPSWKHSVLHLSATTCLPDEHASKTRLLNHSQLRTEKCIIVSALSRPSRKQDYSRQERGWSRSPDRGETRGRKCSDWGRGGEREGGRKLPGGKGGKKKQTRPTTTTHPNPQPR